MTCPVLLLNIHPRNEQAVAVRGFAEEVRVITNLQSVMLRVQVVFLLLEVSQRSEFRRFAGSQVELAIFNAVERRIGFGCGSCGSS